MSASAVVVGAVPTGFSTTNAFGTSPASSSALPTTADDVNGRGKLLRIRQSAIRTRSRLERLARDIEDYRPEQINQCREVHGLEPFAGRPHAAGGGLLRDDRRDGRPGRERLEGDHQLALDDHGAAGEKPHGEEHGDLQRDTPVRLQISDELLIEVAGRRRSVLERGDDAESEWAGGGEREPAQGTLSRPEHEIAARRPEDERKATGGPQHAESREVQQLVVARVIRMAASQF